jgi:hypothetical protein
MRCTVHDSVGEQQKAALQVAQLHTDACINLLR